MVRYLGIDYVEHAINKQRSFLTQSLLAVPQRLEYVDNCIQHLEHCRKPWLRAPLNSIFLKEEKNITSEHLKSLNLDTDDKLESYHHNSESQNGGFGSFEVVPSSNSESLDSLDSLDDFDIILPTKKVDVTNEDFCQEELAALDVHQENDGGWKMEELVFDDYIKEAAKNVPSLQLLSSRLKPSYIKDPLRSKDGKSVTEENIFQHLQLKDHSGQTCKTEENNFESFVKYKIEIPEDKLLEEMLSPFEEKNVIKTLSREEIDKCIQDEAEEADMKFGKLVHCEVHKKTNLHESNFMSPVHLPKQSFLELNDIGSTDSEDFISLACLDSPVMKIRTETMWRVEKLDVSPITTVDMTSPAEILTPKGKCDMLEKIWQHEKYFNDILALRLPEPAMKSMGTESEIPFHVSAKNQLDLAAENDLGKVELTLNWDVLAFAIDQMVKYRSIESLSNFCVEISKPTQEPIEDFEKFSTTDLHDWNDTEIDRIEKPVPKMRSLVKPVDTPHTSGIKKKRRPNVSVGLDPLSDFLIMRSATKFTEDAPEQQTIKIQKNTETCKTFTLLEPLRKESKKKSRIKLVSVQLTDRFRYVMHSLEDSSSSALRLLKDHGEIAPSQTFCNLKSHQSRFLMKQTEKYLQDNKLKVTDCDTYRALVLLHSLVWAHEILAHCCLESAIECLSAMQEMSPSVLSGPLEEIRQKLFHVNYSFQQEKLHHPKVISLCRETEAWIKKKKLIAPDEDVKILVILKRDLKSLYCCLTEALHMGGLINPTEATELCSLGITNSLDAHNCLLLYCGNIRNDFPWAQFSLVVEYEFYEDKPEYKDLCERQNIRYIALSVIISEKTQPHESNRNGVDKMSDSEVYNQAILIGSCVLTEKTELLQLLETRYNILIVERDFKKLQFSNKVHFADITVDERTAIVLHPLSDFEEEWQLEPLTTRVVSLSLKYLACVLVLYSFGGKHNSQYPGVNSNLYKLHAALVNFTSKQKEFDVKVLICYKASEVADLVRRITDEHIQKSLVWKPKDWQNREWIRSDFSVNEKLLLSIPCFNSFSAQLILKKMSLQKLLLLSLEKLITELPWMPEKILKTFLFIANCNAGLQLRNYKCFENEACGDQSAKHDADCVSHMARARNKEMMVNQKTEQISSKCLTQLGDRHEQQRSINHVEECSKQNVYRNQKGKISNKDIVDHRLEKFNMAERHNLDKSGFSQDQDKDQPDHFLQDRNVIPRDSDIVSDCLEEDSEDFLKLSGSPRKANQYMVAELEGKKWNQLSSISKQATYTDQLNDSSDCSTSNINTLARVDCLDNYSNPHWSAEKWPPDRSIRKPLASAHSLICKENNASGFFKTNGSNLSENSLNKTLINKLHNVSNLNSLRKTHYRGSMSETQMPVDLKGIDNVFTGNVNKSTFQQPDFSLRFDKLQTKSYANNAQMFTSAVCFSEKESDCVPQNKHEAKFLDTCHFQDRSGIISDDDRYLRDILNRKRAEISNRTRSNSSNDLERYKVQSVNQTFHSDPGTFNQNFASAKRLFQENVSLLHKPLQTMPISQFRPPAFHRISIGLAQPRRRQTSLESDGVSSEEHAENPRWVTEDDSPPMDFEMQTISPLNRSSKNTGYKTGSVRMEEGLEHNNRMVFGGLHKKRKLTFQKAPGYKNGQTKLVFK